MDKTVQQNRRVLRQVKAVGVAMALQPCGRGVEDATCREMKSGDRITVIGGIGKAGFQIVGVASQPQAGPIVINLAEVGVKGPVFLHHEDDVVHALESACRRSAGHGRGRGCWTGPNNDSLAAGENKEKKQSKTTCKQSSFEESNKAPSGQM